MTVSTYLPGPAPSALSFDGSGDYVRVLRTVPGIGTEGGFELWFRTSSAATGGFIFSTDTNLRTYIHFTGADEITFSKGNPNVKIVGVTGLRDGQWHHAAMFWKNGTAYAYIDGALVGSASFLDTSDGGNLAVAAFRGTWDQFTQVDVDDVREWKVLRTAEQIQENMHRELVGNEPGLVGYWKFNEAGLNPVTANFVGKVAGSTVANPHIMKRSNHTSLVSPATFTTESSNRGYTDIAVLDGATGSQSVAVAGQYPLMLFSFDLIQLAIRERGVPLNTMTTAEAVAWLKANVRSFTASWWGYGSGPSGNNATLTLYNVTSGSYHAGISTTSATVAKVTHPNNNAASQYVDSNGFVHYLAYAPASNGTIASVINTDYVELHVEFVNTAIDSSPSGNNGTVFGASYTTDALELGFGIDTKTDWVSTDIVSAEDFNRIEGNTRVCREYLEKLQYTIPGLTLVLSRDQTYIDFLDGINRMETNIKTIKDNFLTPAEWGGTVTWGVGLGFTWNDMNRIEGNILMLMRYAERVANSVMRCGAWTSGMEMGAV
jgi:hypothetical protein